MGQSLKKILVIDDNPDNLLSIRALIADLFNSLVTITATSGSEGIDLAKKHQPDIILLDILMPELDGFEVCKILKADKQLQDIPVVFVTALKENKENKVNALKSGAEGFLTKPVDEQELVAQIYAMLKIKEANDLKKSEHGRLEKMVNERTIALQEELNLNREINRKLTESEERFRLLHESAGLGIGYYTPDGVVISYNDIAARHMNGKPENFTGKSIYQLFPKEAAQVYMERINKAIQSDAPQVYEDLVQLPAKNIFFLSTFSRILDSRGKVLGVQIFSSDITGLKETEEKLKRVNPS